MLAGAAQTYLHRYGVKVGNRPAIVTAHDPGLAHRLRPREAGAPPRPSSTSAPVSIRR